MNYHIDKKNHFRTLLVITMLIISFLLPGTLNVKAEEKTDMTITFLSVGQGDSTLIESGGKYLLIDGGPTEGGEALLKYLKSKNITKLDYVIATHPHEDHIGGLLTVFQEIPVDILYMNNVSHTTDTYRNFMNLVWSKGIFRRTPYVGGNFQVGSAKVEFISPKGYYYEIMNNYSIVTKITNGKNSFLLTGDAEALAEEEMLNSGISLKADVLKVPHHSSKTSTTIPFIQAVDPAFSVIELGLNNVYGFPKKQTLGRLANSNVYRTDKQGNIVMHSDGTNITVDNKPSIAAKSKDKTGELQTLYNMNVVSNYEEIKLQNTSDKATYKVLSTNQVTLDFSAEYGVSKEKSIQYMKVNSDQKFNAKGKWTTGDYVTVDRDFKGSVYVKFTNQAGNSVIKKTTGFGVDISKPDKPKVIMKGSKVGFVSSLDEENSYSTMINKAATMQFDASFGPSGKDSIEYQVVEKGESYDPQNEWIEDDEVSFEEDFAGRIYVRFTDKAGHQSIRKTEGFTVDVTPPDHAFVTSNFTDTKLLKKSAATTYDVKTRQDVNLYFGADFGISGKKKIEYKFVDTRPNNKVKQVWKTGDNVKVNFSFKGYVLVRFTDKAGNVTEKKTSGMVVNKYPVKEKTVKAD